MRDTCRPALFLAMLTVAVPCVAQQPDLSGVTLVTLPLGGHLYMLEATGDVAGNIAVSAGPDGVLIVDDQWAGLAGQIQGTLATLHDGPLRFILNTHHHDDHSDGNAALSAATGATVVAHDMARVRLQHKQAAHWPTVTFDDRLSIYFNDEKIEVLSVPGGHTDNDSIVLFTKSNVVHMGDLLNSARSSFPLADLGAGGNAVRILENIGRILPLIPADAQIIAGHGPLSNRADLQDLHEMLTFTIEFVRRKRARGLSIEAIAAEGFPPSLDDWNHGYISAADWIEMIYRSLEENAR